MMEPFGLGLSTPSDTQGWVCLIAVLVGIGLSFGLGVGWSTSVLALVTATAVYAINGRLFVPIAIGCVGVGTLLCTRRAVAGDGWRRAVREGVLIAAGLVLYESGRAVVEGDPETAVRHAHSVLNAEGRLGLAFEESLQRLVLDHDRVMTLFNGIYTWGFLALVLSILLWLYATNDDSYRLMRTGLGVSALLALVIMALFPLAPPRLTPSSGLVDSQALFGRGYQFVNDYAAMPSLHVGWTLLASYALGRSVRSSFGHVVAFAPVLTMMATVIVTGNHYWLDGVVGSVVVLIPVIVLERVSRRHRGFSHRSIAWSH